jgi:hypothetical protein
MNGAFFVPGGGSAFSHPVAPPWCYLTLVTHDQALARALLAVTRAGGRAWRTEVGLFRDMRGHKHMIGVRGLADILGLCPGGRALAVEVKTGRGVMTAEQRAFARMFAGMGGLHIEARYTDTEDGDATIAAALIHSRDKVPSR